MVRLRTNPVGAAGHGTGAVRADEFVGVRMLVRQRFHRHKIARASRRPENTNAFESAMGRAARVRRKQNSATHRVAGKESHVQAGVDGGLQMAKHFNGIIFVVAHR